MDDAKLLVMLHQLGMDDLSYRALALLPLVQVAWADGTVHDSERALIEQLAMEQWKVGDEGLRMLQNWLHYAPSADYIRRGQGALLALARAGGDDEVDLDDVVAFSRRVAQATGGLFGFGAISRAEHEALGQIAKVLGVQGASVGGPPEDEPETRPSLGRVTLTISTSLLDLDINNGVLEPDPSLGTPKGHRIPVQREGVLIGSALDAGVIIESAPGLAPHHARVFERNRMFYVTDLGSETGTWVNGERIAERRLLGGEEITLGSSVTFTFKLLRRIAKQLF